MERSRSSVLFFAGLGAGIVLLFLANLFWGSVSIPAEKVVRILTGGSSGKDTWDYIVLQSRLPQAITAMAAGAALAVSGLMLQTVFNNPLAGPSILGINAGASLGVAVVMLLMGGTVGGSLAGTPFGGYLAVVAGAFVGASLVLAIIIFFSTLVRSNVMLLIIGLMVGYITSSLISLLNFFATTEGVFSYTMWGMGDFSGVSMEQIPYFGTLIVLGLGISLLLVKPMNALLLGERYAENLGVRVRRVRVWMLAATGLMTAVTTAFCGPISFIGLAVPHMARLLLGSSNHTILLPVTLLLGAAVTLFCNLCCTLPGGSSVLPLNVITPILGVPVILYVIVNQKRIQYFN